MRFRDYVLANFESPEFIEDVKSDADREEARSALQYERARIQYELGRVIGMTDERKALLERLSKVDMAQKMLKISRVSREEVILDAIRKHKARILASNVASEADSELWEVLK